MDYLERHKISHGRYILQGTEPVPEPDLLKWAAWFETADRVVEQTELAPDLFVSTVFLSLDHGWGSLVPLLFETMVFHHGHGKECERYATWQEAEKAHAAMCTHLRRAYFLPDSVILPT